MAEDDTITLSPCLQNQAYAYASQHPQGKILSAPVPGREGYFEWHRMRSHRAEA